MTLTTSKGPTLSGGLTNRKREWNKITKYSSSHSLLNQTGFCKFRNKLGYNDGARNCHLSAVHRNSLLSPLVGQRKPRFPVFHNKLSSDFGVEDADERLASNEAEDTALLGSTKNVDVQ